MSDKTVYLVLIFLGLIIVACIVMLYIIGNNLNL